MKMGTKKLRRLGVEVAALESRRLFATFFVDAGATGNGNGGSWGNAFPSFQAALTAANANPDSDMIKVAGGTYTPTTSVGDPRSATFESFTPVTVMGGFAGSTTPATPDEKTGTTIFSGAIGTNLVGDNLYNIWTINTAGVVAVDGVTFQLGHADGTGVNSNGGAIHSFRNDLTVTNCLFTSNFATQGGAIYSQEGRLRVTSSNFRTNSATSGGGIYINATTGPSGDNSVSQSTFFLNISQADGGGIYNATGASSLRVDRTLFHGNVAVSSGGGIYNNTSNASSVINSIFVLNQAGFDAPTGIGGAIHNDNSGAMDVYWSTLTGNTAMTGGAIQNAGFLATVNSIYWQNTSGDGKSITVENGGLLRVDYTLVEAGTAPVGLTGSGAGLISGDPLFSRAPAGEDAGDLRLTSASPAVNAGDLAIVAVPATDFMGSARVIGTKPNIGAIEERVDVTAPSSMIAALPATQTDLAINLSWTGMDDAEGTGIAKYTVFFSDNGSTPAPFVVLTNVSTTSGVFIGTPGHTYGFHVIATDVAGNVEAAPTMADATITITPTSPPPPPNTPLPVPTPAPDSDVDLEPSEPKTKLPKPVFGALVGGSTVTGSFKVTNKGSKAVSKKNGSYGIYLSEDETVSSGDVPLATIQFKKGVTVKGKGSLTVSYKIELPDDYTGTGNLLARVNAPSDGSATEIGETSYANNTVNLGSVTLAAPFTNLSAPDTLTAPTNVTAGSSKPVYATFTLKNSSNRTFSDTVTIRTSLGTDGTTVNTRKKVKIKPGRTVKIKVLIQSPETAGNYTLTTTVDPDQTFSQTMITDDSVTTPIMFE